jgi:hypothetical protein
MNPKTLTLLLILARAHTRRPLLTVEAQELAQLIDALDYWLRTGLAKPLAEMTLPELHARLDVLCDTIKEVSAELANRTSEPRSPR